jgi:outer membrane lipoprotein carrier protein
MHRPKAAMPIRPVLALTLLAISLSAVASGIDKLKKFVRDTTTARAGFTQTVIDRNGKTIQEAAGTMAFSRPGRFRWVYRKPYEQLIVGDGAKLWVYDADLDQVTARKLDESIGSSPAALLAGENEIEKIFDLKDAGDREGMDWLEATPKGGDSSFERVRLGFDGRTLARMELLDNFGQTTVLRFFDLKRNPSIPASEFRFTPPQGADVIGE